jgi:2,3,4,5-tetrahydropyridine-2-carboxylate N-succinyltransferase
MNELREKSERLKRDGGSNKEIYDHFLEVISELESGRIRAAEKTNGEWKANTWLKEVILTGFRIGNLKEIQGGILNFFDKDTMPLHGFSIESRVRIVPGGSSVRCGSYVAPGVVIMPPSYINTGAYVDEGTMIDSHALVGSCAQVGKSVHLSAASQIGGVLEPAGALPVIVEDNVFIGGNCGIYEGTILKERCVIGTGVILNSSTPVFDSVNGEFLRAGTGKPLEIPEGAVVISGSRPITRGKGKEEGIHLYCPVLIKYRDSKTEGAVSLEELLR